MPLAFRPPLNDHEIEVLTSMPKTRGGHVIHPRYAPREQEADYIRRLGEWGRRTPRQDWPQWFADFVDQRRRDTSVRANDPGVGAGDQPASDGRLAGGEG